ncbi:endocuticle structural protein SgAbd-6-like [Contarinia nasturtii]|uniref:endocuticle structural protein SgAbd-6-like n=1 Tax=Contarinia nasturtii TaxID=265458 RepID=UPI0012D4A58D|nr:endocuticle structural protein SgAbd-6-like [Contarinia nasturtii]
MANQLFMLMTVLSVVAIALAQTSQLQKSEPEPQVIRETNNNDGSGNYLFTYELDNGQIFSETGQLKTIGEQQAVVKSGAYSFVGADGITYWVTYYADETGFHPTIGTGPGGIEKGANAKVH